MWNKGPAEDELVNNPQIGDLYAADLTYFSKANFADIESGKPAYGLIKVVEVTPDTVTLITETGAWAERRGAIQELRGDLGGITWDEKERIVIQHSELKSAFSKDHILATRRM